VLAAARRLFAKDGYARTSIRAIAAEADVNHALVVTYFGGKEALFMEAVGRFQIPQDALLGDIEGMGARIARAYMDRWENMTEDDPWLVLIRSSLSHEGSYQLLRAELEAQQAAPLAAALGRAGDGPRRSAMVECLIAGMIMTRYIYRIEPARSLPAAAFEAAFANSLQHAISGPAPRLPGRRALRAHAIEHDGEGPDAQRGVPLAMLGGHADGGQNGHQLRQAQVRPDRAGLLGAVEQRLDGVPHAAADIGHARLGVDPGPDEQVGYGLGAHGVLHHPGEVAEERLARVGCAGQFRRLGDQGLDAPDDDGLIQRLLGGEVPVDRGQAHARVRGDRAHGCGQAVAGQDRLGRGQHALPVAGRVGAPGRRFVVHFSRPPNPD
jgi:AcrR family transcriptional regulator